MTILIILPTQLFNHPKSFWKQFKEVIVYEEPYYVNKTMHPVKLWFHRASMLEYFKSIDHKKKKYMEYDQTAELPTLGCLFHPIDKKMVTKYKKYEILESPMFLMRMVDVNEYRTKTLSQLNIYKSMRTKFNILMNRDGTPMGGKWSFDESNRKTFPKDYREPKIIEYNSEIIQRAKSIIDLSVRRIHGYYNTYE